MIRSTLSIIPLTLWMVSSSVVHASVVEYTDFAEWQATAGSFSTIDFTGFPAGTILSDQYAELGVHFPDGNDQILNLQGFENDGWGLKGHIITAGEIHVSLTAPQKWIAVHFPGAVTFELLRKGELIYTSEGFFPTGQGNFGGLISTLAFDEVVISDLLDGTVFIDDLHFGVPAPGAMPLLALSGAVGMRTRRQR